MENVLNEMPTKVKGIKVVQNIRDVIESLFKGEKVCRFEYGNSLYPIIKSGEFCLLSPIASIDEIKIGDIVFCKIENGEYPTYMTHMVVGMSSSAHDGNKWFQIGSSMGEIYGWTRTIFAKAQGMGTRMMEDIHRPRWHDETFDFPILKKHKH